ncbi:uracil phosphoribosyltransferase [Roseibacillus ishigakijimensis]|uniref:Uracil phosphoribosyltransferase n=1 Tax=Roseibacillus ishigakijimensis TaxID=454146 RepID=A0A934VLX5_9BACT|nr:uracil phosphoribosyltransferase [Roseibacillus ishigakijimensis]MBK1833536.1 uracil phosphoribosyltransferase [Roseibacillus ishigakijimensis]
MSRLTVIDHPLVQHKLALLRDAATPFPTFRRVLRETTWLLAYEATRHLRVEATPIETPLEKMTAHTLPERGPVLISILRAGNGLVDGLMDVMPEAAVGQLGLVRNPKTLQPEEYYCKLPAAIEERQVILADPMLATGGSTVAAIDRLREKGVRDLVFLCLVAAPEGVAALQAAHPEVPVFTAALDRELNEKGYILPGLGDAGDRIYGTE